MQDVIITLPVDVGDTNVTTDEVFRRHEEHLHRSIYIAENHAMDMRKLLTLYRTPPKATTTYKGNMKTAYKFTEDVLILDPLGNTITGPMIGEVSFSIPVGTPAALRLAFTQRIGAMALHRPVIGGLIDTQSI